MSAVWTRCRRLVASLMLAGMTSLVLHGGAFSAAHPGSGDPFGCMFAVQAGHVHESHPAAAHDRSAVHGRAAGHESGAPHTHSTLAAQADRDGAGDHRQARSGVATPCCSSVCTVALSAFDSPVLSAPIALAVTLVPASQSGSGIDPHGLMRPPRAPRSA